MVGHPSKKSADVVFLSGLSDTFQFHCKACGQCCGQYQIVLSPYDILRLRKATGLLTHELIGRGTVRVVRESFKRIFGFAPLADVFDSFGLSQCDTVPAAFLRLRSDESGKRVCEFLSPAENGKRLCTIYEHRPTMCRLHPLGCTTVAGKRLWFFRKPLCEPHSPVAQTVADWIRTSHLQPYLRANSQYLKWMLGLMAESERFNRISEQQWETLEKILFDFDSHGAAKRRNGKECPMKNAPRKTSAFSMQILDTVFHRWLYDVRNHIG